MSVDLRKQKKKKTDFRQNGNLHPWNMRSRDPLITIPNKGAYTNFKEPIYTYHHIPSCVIILLNGLPITLAEHSVMWPPDYISININTMTLGGLFFHLFTLTLLSTLSSQVRMPPCLLPPVVLSAPVAIVCHIDDNHPPYNRKHKKCLLFNSLKLVKFILQET